MKLCKKLLIMILIMISSILCTNQVFAMVEAQTPDSKGTKYVLDPEKYNPSTEGITEKDKLVVVPKVRHILGWIRNIAVILAVITLMIIGLKYIFASVNERAKYKETLIPWIVGGVVLVTGTTLITFIYDVVT